MDISTVSKHTFNLSNESFLYMKILAKRCGIDLDEYKKEALFNRLIKRLRYLNLSNFDSYCHRLRIDITEEEKFINLITNSTTMFFREKHHLDYFKETLLPSLIANKNKIRIWSAGCSTGEEPYSLAIIVRETIADLSHLDIKILATDINSDALFNATKGIYEIKNIRKMSSLRQKKWFHIIGENDSGDTLVQIDDTLKKLITFNQLNLMDAWPLHGPFDAIFCRNVLIYFKREPCQKILGKFHSLLEKNGVLFLGYSENLYGEDKKYTSIGQTTYMKVSE